MDKASSGRRFKVAEITQKSKDQTSSSFEDIASEMADADLPSVAWKEYAVKAHKLGLSIQAISTQLTKLGVPHDDLIRLERALSIAAEPIRTALPWEPCMGSRFVISAIKYNIDVTPEIISKQMISWGFDITRPATIQLVKTEYQTLKKMLKREIPIDMMLRREFVRTAYRLGYSVDEIVVLSKKMDPGYLATEEWVSGVLGGRKGATLRMKSRDWNEHAAEFINAAYEIGVEPGDVQLQLTVLGFNLEISYL